MMRCTFKSVNYASRITDGKGQKMNDITIDPKICNGKPVIAGTRIPITVILDQFAGGDNMADIQRKYPEITAERILAAIRYCHAMIENTETEAVMA